MLHFALRTGIIDETVGVELQGLWDWLNFCLEKNDAFCLSAHHKADVAYLLQMQEPGCLSRGMPNEPLDEAMLLQHELVVCSTHAVRANSPAVTRSSNIHAALVKVDCESLSIHSKTCTKTCGVKGPLLSGS